MGRPKGSKNKPKATNAISKLQELDELINQNAAVRTDIESQLAALAEETASKKLELREAKKKQTKLNRQKKAIESKAAEQAKREELEGLMNELLSSGKDIDEIKAAIQGL